MKIINEFSTGNNLLTYYVAKISNGEYKTGYRDVLEDDQDHFNDEVHVSYEDALNALAQKIGDEVIDGDAFTALYTPVMDTLRKHKWEQIEGTLLWEHDFDGLGCYAILSTKNGYAWTFFDDVEEDEIEDGYETKQDVIQFLIENADRTLTFDKDRANVKAVLNQADL